MSWSTRAWGTNRSPSMSISKFVVNWVKANSAIHYSTTTTDPSACATELTRTARTKAPHAAHMLFSTKESNTTRMTMEYGTMSPPRNVVSTKDAPVGPGGNVGLSSVFRIRVHKTAQDGPTLHVWQRLQGGVPYERELEPGAKTDFGWETRRKASFPRKGTTRTCCHRR